MEMLLMKLGVKIQGLREKEWVTLGDILTLKGKGKEWVTGDILTLKG
jgi:hypothetical protein